jgi:hypothetical protein
VVAGVFRGSGVYAALEIRGELLSMAAKGEFCKATKRDGNPCQAHPLPGSDMCVFHDPGCAAKRAEGRRAGGMERSRKMALLPAEQPDLPLKTIADLVNLQALTINALLRGKVSTRLATTIFYGASVLANLIQRGSLEDRLAAIESIVSRPRPSSALAFAGNLQDAELEFDRDPGECSREDTGSGCEGPPEGLGVESQEETATVNLGGLAFEEEDPAGGGSGTHPEGLGVESREKAAEEDADERSGDDASGGQD